MTSMGTTEKVHIPPERWLHELNRRYPSIWADLRKAYADPMKILKPSASVLLDGLPSWCPMPTFFPFLALTERYGRDIYLRNPDEIMTIASMYQWRAGKGIYRFDPELYKALISQPFSGDIPNECLYRLPEWAVYVETPGLTIYHRSVDGFIAHLDFNLHDKTVDLQFLLFWSDSISPKSIALPLGDGGLSEALDRLDAIDSLFNIPRGRQLGVLEDYRRALSSMLQLVLYLCSEQPDMPSIPSPQRTFSGGIRSPSEVRQWDVGLRIGAALRKASSSCGSLPEGIDLTDSNTPGDGSTQSTNEKHESKGHARPRAHIRSAHWSTYWTGPRTGQQTPILRWIPPLPINMDWKKQVPTVIHSVTAI